MAANDGRSTDALDERNRVLLRVLTILICVSSCITAGYLSAAIRSSDAWYAGLNKPTWTPPGWVFGVVWTLIYATMGIALALILLRNEKPGGRGRALVAFIVQLVLNLAWSPIFFRLHSIGGGLIVIVALWFAIAWTIAAFWSVRDLAAVLLLPYWAWVTFAVALNGAIWASATLSVEPRHTQVMTEAGARFIGVRAQLKRDVFRQHRRAEVRDGFTRQNRYVGATV